MGTILSSMKDYKSLTHLAGVFLAGIALVTAAALFFLPAPRVAPEVTLEDTPVGGSTRAEVETRVAELATRMDRPPRDASLDPHTWAIHPETDGQAVDRAKTVQKVMDAAPGEKVICTLKTLKPQVTATRLAATIQPAGSFETVILDRNPARVYNIEVAADHIDGTVLQPGETFSFNERTWPADGREYQEAPIILNGRLVPGRGGGICQVSTTLYNATLAAGLEIVERHRHTILVEYAPPGRDATVYDNKDLRLKNNGAFPLMLRSHVEGDRVEVRILEHRPLAPA